MTQKIQFGDFQTPHALAQEVAAFLKTVHPEVSAVLEPTCGKGSFIRACMDQWGDSCDYFGFDINENYIRSFKETLADFPHCRLEVTDFFTKRWEDVFAKKPDWLIIGNPPWVTNTALSVLQSKNLPAKSNFQQHEGFAAKTGKANFDIAEWMLIKLIETLKETPACLAMLCKTATARKVLRYFWNKDACIFNTSIHQIDAKKHFNVAVDACLFVTEIQDGKRSAEAGVYSSLDFMNKIGHIGMVKDELVADVDLYKKYKYLDGGQGYPWRSGVKHDAAKVMELKKIDSDLYVNGFGQQYELEDNHLFPLLKSSDIANQKLCPRRYVILTQRNVGDDTRERLLESPRTWAYLEKYAEKLNARKSIIYKKRAPYSIFGIGDYSFSPWKVVVSGMYKKCLFSVVGQQDGKPVMVDDTCYFLPCYSQQEATLICELLNSHECKEFISTLAFFDAKRPLTLDLLKRINLSALAKTLGRYDFDEIYFSTRPQDFVRSELLFA